MKSSYLALVILVTLGLFAVSCQKETERPVSPDTKKANEFRAFVQNKGFVVTSYYADKPIDYVKNDGIETMETDLNKYIYNHIKDDKNELLENGQLLIHQNTVKAPGNDSATLTRNWSIGVNSRGVYINFVDYDYLPRQYKLAEFTDKYFLVYVDWSGTDAKVYSKFELK